RSSSCSGRLYRSFNEEWKELRNEIHRRPGSTSKIYFGGQEGAVRRRDESARPFQRRKRIDGPDCIAAARYFKSGRGRCRKRSIASERFARLERVAEVERTTSNLTATGESSDQRNRIRFSTG